MYLPALLALTVFGAVTMADDKASLQAVSNSVGQFSTDFYKNVAPKQEGNLIMSPLSAHMVLSMAALAAGGNTAKVMRESLHLPNEDIVAHEGFENLIDSLNNVEKVDLKLANKIFTAINFPVKPEFKQLTSGPFRSESGELDFSKSADAAKAVNDWCDEKTNHKIKELLTKDDVDSSTVMVLLNAVYFKGNWKDKFNKDNTKDRPFHVDEKTEKNVPTMFKTGKMIYGELPDLKAKFVELPYENDNITMVIVVPDEITGLKDIESKLEKLTRSNLNAAGTQRDVELYLPKFKIESTIDLKESLQQLGMAEIFTDSANFTGISDVPLKVDKVKQKAFIEVNEEGSEAAAVTVMGIRLTSSMIQIVPIVEFKVDRPFICTIVDTRTRTNLFFSRVVDPKTA